MAHSAPLLSIPDENAKSKSLGRSCSAQDMKKEGGGKKANVRRLRSLKVTLTNSPEPSALPPALQSLQPILTTKSGESFPLSKEDLTVERSIGSGAYGYVDRCVHRPTEIVMAVKRISLTMDETERRRLLMDLEINRKVRECPEACFFYGAFFQEGHVYICMEIMDASLDNFYKKALGSGLSMPENYLVHIAISIINGLDFLYSRLKVMHRDVKPSNILIDKNARVKVCDFGVSAVLVNSLARTNIGCKPYMAPERLDLDVSKGFNVKSDIWSLGITLVELGDGIFPYDQKKWRNPFDQMKQVFEQPAPNFYNEIYSQEIRQWMTLILNKNPDQRACYEDILRHPYIEEKRKLLANESVQLNLKNWIVDVIDSQ